MKTSDKSRKKTIDDLATLCGLVDDGRETLDSVLRESTLAAQLKEDVKGSAEDLRKVYTRLCEIREELKIPKEALI